MFLGRLQTDNKFSPLSAGNVTSLGMALVVIKGYNPQGFLVNDPYGEIMATTGVRPWYDPVNNPGLIFGENLHYSNNLIAVACGS